ncbi:MAG: prolyl oligopeptidase family serine peptidase [Oscillospiraceae bacterium]|jgi:dipeptidyl aminopeptidase/acylaminoacyl peptidase|nr:prolyl oligopeptidase family serine peptidase [Oscillospiraceae bacterium]
MRGDELMRMLKKASLGLTLSLLLVFQLLVGFVAAEEIDAITHIQVPEKTRSYELLSKNKKIEKEYLTKVVKWPSFLAMSTFLFAFEDAVSPLRQAEERGLLDGLSSFASPDKNVSLGDAIEFLFKMTRLCVDVNIENWFWWFQHNGSIPETKKITDIFSWSVAINIFEEIRNERAKYFSLTTDLELPLQELVFVPKEKSDYTWSPDGKYGAFLAEWSGVFNVFVYNSITKSIRRVSSATTSDVTRVIWGDNGNYLFYVRDDGYDECNHIWMSRFNGKREKDLTPTPKKCSYHFEGQLWKGDMYYMCVSHYDKAVRAYVYDAIDVESGEMIPDEIPSEKFLPFYLSIPGDSANRIKVIDEGNHGENAKVYMQDRETYAEDLIFKTNHWRRFIPLFVSEDGLKLYGLSDNSTQTICPVALDLRTGKLKVLFEDFNYDTLDAGLNVDYGKIVCDFGTGVPLVVQYYAKTFKSAGLVPKVQNALNTVKEKLGFSEVRVLDISSDLEIYTLQRELPCGNGAKYGYDHVTGNLWYVDATEEEKDDKYLTNWIFCTQMIPISYVARDGIKIEGYLSLPSGKAPENLPTVVMVHGGPQSCDMWVTSSLSEFFRRLGCAVFQINFRGSTGRGHKFMNLGNKQWGTTMQYDIVDGTKWLIKKGVANKDRICIYGASFGGFSVLWGLAFTPNLYACGVDKCGISDIVSHLSNFKDDWLYGRSADNFHIGDPVKDANELKAVSPYYHLDNITKPLLLVHGANDTRVKRDESDRVWKSLWNRNADVIYMVRENEGHGFSHSKNLLDFYTLLRKFIIKHLDLKPGEKLAA